MRKIKVAQIGTSESEHAVQVFKSLNKQTDIFEVIGYADVDHHDKPLHEVFRKHRCMTAEELLAITDLDAVIVECDEKLQTHYATMAAKRGLAIHLEKPCGDDGEAFEKMIDIIETNGLVFSTGYMYRYNPAVRRALEIVASGKLGNIYSVEAQMNCLHPPAVRNWLRNFQGGMMFYLGCHLIDLIYQIQGDPLSVTPLNMTTDEYGEDFGMALLHYPNGISFAKATAVEPGGFMRRQLVICGTNGTIEVRPLERLLDGENVSTEIKECYIDDNGHCPWSAEGKLTVFPPYNRYDEMMSEFAAMVRGEKNNPYTPAYERCLHKLLLQACGNG